MAAKKGNKNAQKYDLEFVRSEMLKLLKELRENPEIVFIGEMFLDKSYTRKTFYSWRDKFPDDEIVSDSHARIRETLESRLVVGGLKGKLQPMLTKFVLEFGYNWSVIDDDDDITGDIVKLN